MHVSIAKTAKIYMFPYGIVDGGLSVTNTREKLLEAKYFLERMIENHAERNAFKYNLSAFLSAARSVTLIMQNEYHNILGFDKWYSIQQDKMKADDKMKILDAKRDVTIHQESVSPRAHVDVHITEHITLTESVSVQVIRADGTGVDPCSLETPSRCRHIRGLPGL